MLADVKHGERLVAFRDLLDNDGGFETHPLGDLTEAHRGDAVHRRHDRPAEGRDADARQSDRRLRAISWRSDARRDETRCAEGEERMLCVLPLFHIYALSVLLVLGLRLGRRDRPASALRPGGRGEGHRAQEDHLSLPACRRCMSRFSICRVCEPIESLLAQTARRAARRCRVEVQQELREADRAAAVPRAGA